MQQLKFEYALDPADNLIRGEDLRYAYSGSGVATLIDKNGKGYKVEAGTRNLKSIDAEAGTLTLYSDVEEAEDTEDEEEEGPSYEDLTKRELKELLTERDIEFPQGANKAELIAILEEADEASEEEDGEDTESTDSEGDTE